MNNGENIKLKEDPVAGFKLNGVDHGDKSIDRLKNFTGIKEKKELALNLFAKEEWVELAECCAGLVALSTNDRDVLFMFTTALAQLGFLEDALIVANKLLNLHPDQLDYKQLRDILISEKRRKEEAELIEIMPVKEKGFEGNITLVTACMNREEHLLKSLPLWLKLPFVSEIIIVDWSNSKSLVRLADIDNRVKVIRVESEDRWVLSYAYNIGVFSARNKIILKCDADCVPDEKIFKNLPDSNSFYAGYWKTGALTGKACVNGQCMFLKEQFEQVNGYSEFIRTYGRDDEDLYDRLMRNGFFRKEIESDLLSFSEHSDEMRVGNQFVAARNSEDAIYRSTIYNEMRNFFIGKKMQWTKSCKRAKYISKNKLSERAVIVNRIKEFELQVPDDVNLDAELYSLRYMVKSKYNLTEQITAQYCREKCIALLNKK